MIVKRLAALLLALLLTVAAALPAAAVGDDPIPDEDRFGGKDWDTVVKEFFAAKGVNPYFIGIAYYNTVTGEEHCLNGDVYRYAASVYKLPLNMVYAERVYNGEMQMDDVIGGWTYRELQRLSLELSSNSAAATLCTSLGSRQQYVEAIAPMVLDDADEFSQEFLFKCYCNEFTPAQILHALKLLYADPNRYPDVLEHMRVAQQSEYFCLTERRFPIAHKYGCLFSEEDGSITMNDCGIIYTDDPILLVMFTESISAFSLMADFCTLMCDYAQYTRAVRLRAEAEEAAREAEAAEQERLAREAEEAERERLAEEAERERLAQEAAAAAAEEKARQAEEAAQWRMTDAGRCLLSVAGAAAVLSLIAAPIFGRKPKESEAPEEDGTCDTEND